MSFTENNIILMRLVNRSHYIVFELGYKKFNSLLVSDQSFGGKFNETPSNGPHGSRWLFSNLYKEVNLIKLNININLYNYHLYFYIFINDFFLKCLFQQT